VAKKPAFPGRLKALNWTSSLVLVTGAGGFVKSHLTKRLMALVANTRAFVHYNPAGQWGRLDKSPIKGNIEIMAEDVQHNVIVAGVPTRKLKRMEVAS